jgi:glycosyltransferase involved in cell wall biosynthesis
VTDGIRPVTIGLPVYNAERYLSEAIDSILSQTYRDFTLLVADNASTDRTLEIVESYAARDDRIVVLHSETNRGAAWNFNRAFEESRSPFFKWAAADDMLAPTCVERCLDALRAAPADAVLAFPHTRIVDGEGRVAGEYVDPLATGPDEPPHRRFARVVGKMVKGNLVFALTRADALRKTRLHGGYPSSDYVLIGELALLGSFVEVPEPLFLRREHAQMSRRANASLAEISQWFDPSARPVRSENRRLFKEYLAAIRHVDLPAAERALAGVTLVVTWGRRRWLLHQRGWIRRRLGR